MSPFVFIERSRFGKVFFELRGDRLRISGTRAFEKCEIEVELHALAHRSERLSTRFYRPIFLLGVPGLIMLAMTAGLALQTALPSGAVIYFAYVTGLFGAAFLGTGLQWIPRVEVARFKDVVGRVVFDVVKEKAHASDFEEFVELLEHSIVESKEPNKASLRTLTTGPFSLIKAQSNRRPLSG